MNKHTTLEALRSAASGLLSKTLLFALTLIAVGSLFAFLKLLLLPAAPPPDDANVSSFLGIALLIMQFVILALMVAGIVRELRNLLHNLRSSKRDEDSK